MKLFENGVGRPSNEILRKRKIFIASVVGAIALLLVLGGVLLFGNNSTSRLQGASSGTSYINLSVKDSGIKISGCNITIPYIIENRSTKTISVYSAKITDTSNVTYASRTVSGLVPAGKGNKKVINITYNAKYLPHTPQTLRTVIYFKVDGKEYYHTEYFATSYSVAQGIKKCKNSAATTTKKVTTKKTAVKTTTKKVTTKKTTVKTTKASGAGTTYIKHLVTSSSISVSSDYKYLSIPIAIENRTNNAVSITRSKITDSNNKTYASVKINKNINGGIGIKYTTKLNFSMANIPSNAKSLRMVTYFKVDGVEKYVVEQIALTSSVQEKIKACKNASQNGSSYVSVGVSTSKVYTNSNCKLVIPVNVTNKSGKEINVISANVTDLNKSTEVFSKATKKATIAAGKGKKATVNFEFPVLGSNFDINGGLDWAKNDITLGDVKVVLYFQVDGKGKYYVTDQVNIPAKEVAKIKTCKTQNGNSFIDHHVNNSSISVDKNCNLVVKANIKNVAGKKITATNAKLTTNDNKTVYATAKATGDKVLTEKGTSMYTTFKFPQAGAKNALSKGNLGIRMVTYFNVNEYGVSYWVAEKISVPKSILEKLNSCKATTKATKKTNTASKSITLKCPTSAKINQVFKCTTDQVGVTITLGGANSLASGYSSKFTTTSSDKSKDIKYASVLFTNYKSIIKKDSNGKEYINAQVTASKSGYKTTTKYVKIYK